MDKAKNLEELLKQLRGQVLTEIRETENGIEFRTADGTAFVLPYAGGAAEWAKAE